MSTNLDHLPPNHCLPQVPRADTAADVKTYGFLGLTDGPTIFNNSGKIYNISGPALNVTAAYYLYVSSVSWTYSSERHKALWPEQYWQDPRTDEYAFSNSYIYGYTLPGTDVVLDGPQVNAAGSCQQTATYKWGFSFLLLLIVLVLFIVWLVGTYLLWLDAHLHSRLDMVKRDMGLYRAALDLVSVIQGDLDKDIDSLTPNRVLSKNINANKEAGMISLQHLSGNLPSNTRMMNFQDWGRAGGYSRWTPRLTLAVLLVLLIITPILVMASSINTMMSSPTVIGVMSTLTFLVIINLLVLGRGTRRSLLRRHASNSGISHHPLQSFDDHLPSDTSRKPTSETITVMDDPACETDTYHVEQPLKTATPYATSPTS